MILKCNDCSTCSKSTHKEYKPRCISTKKDFYFVFISLCFGYRANQLKYFVRTIWRRRRGDLFRLNQLFCAQTMNGKMLLLLQATVNVRASQRVLWNNSILFRLDFGAASLPDRKHQFVSINIFLFIHFHWNRNSCYLKRGRNKLFTTLCFITKYLR